MTTFAPLLDLLAEVPDPRRAQEQIDKLPYVLLFSTLAIMTGGNSYRSSVTFIDANRRKLNAAFGLHWRRAPAHTAIRYILQGLDERARPTPRRCKRSGSDGCRRSGWDKPWEGLGGHARAQQNCAEHRAGGAREQSGASPCTAAGRSSSPLAVLPENWEAYIGWACGVLRRMPKPESVPRPPRRCKALPTVLR